VDTFLWGVGIFLLVNAVLCLWRAYAGPTVVDRVLAINIVGTKTLVVLVLLAFVFDRSLFVDVALVYALLNLVITLAASRFLETGRLSEDWQS
jgi:multicomponent Na+:H+ antiporter subunit F